MSPLPRVLPVLPQIDTVVVLMLENRSLSTVIGWAGTDPSFITAMGKRAAAAPRFDTDGLTLHHHRAALVCAADSDGYVAALRNTRRT